MEPFYYFYISFWDVMGLLLSMLKTFVVSAFYGKTVGNLGLIWGTIISHFQYGDCCERASISSFVEYAFSDNAFRKLR